MSIPKLNYLALMHVVMLWNFQLFRCISLHENLSVYGRISMWSSDSLRAIQFSLLCCIGLNAREAFVESAKYRWCIRVKASISHNNKFGDYFNSIILCFMTKFLNFSIWVCANDKLQCECKFPEQLESVCIGKYGNLNSMALVNLGMLNRNSKLLLDVKSISNSNI